MKKSVLIVFILLIAALFLGCAGQRHTVQRIQQDPDPRAVNLFVDGLMFEADQNQAAALLSYLEALLYDSTSSTLNLAAARCYYLLDRTESALRCLDRGLRRNPQNVEAIKLLARIRFDR